MKTSTKIILVLFALTAIATVVLFPNLSSAFKFENAKLSVNFSPLGYVTLALFILATSFALVLYFKFLKTLSLNKVLFFSTLPFTLMYGFSLYSLAYLTNLDNAFANSVKTILNISTENQYNSILWSVLLTILYILLLFIVYFIVTKPIYKMEKLLERLGDGKIREKKFRLGGGKQFSHIGHSLLKINNQFSKTEDGQAVHLPKVISKFVDSEDAAKLQSGQMVSRFTYLSLCYITDFGEKSLQGSYDILKLYINIVEPLIKRFNGLAADNCSFGSLGVFFRAEDALDFSHAVCRALRIKAKRYGLKINRFVAVSGQKTHYSINKKGKLIINDENITTLKNIIDFSTQVQCCLIFTNTILDNLPASYLLKYRYIGTLFNQNLNLFESLEVYGRHKRMLLDKQKQPFEKGVMFFGQGHKERAKLIFENLLQENPNDKAAFLYLNQCKN